EIPQAIYEGWDARLKGEKLEQYWQHLFADYRKAHPELAQEFTRRMTKQLPDNWHAEAQALIDETQQKKETIATRKASQNCLNHFAKVLPELMGGSADLTGSNLTNWQGVKPFSKETPEGQYI